MSRSRELYTWRKLENIAFEMAKKICLTKATPSLSDEFYTEIYSWAAKKDKLGGIDLGADEITAAARLEKLTELNKLINLSYDMLDRTSEAADRDAIKQYVFELQMLKEEIIGFEMKNMFAEMSLAGNDNPHLQEMYVSRLERTKEKLGFGSYSDDMMKRTSTKKMVEMGDVAWKAMREACEWGDITLDQYLEFAKNYNEMIKQQKKQASWFTGREWKELDMTVGRQYEDLKDKLTNKKGDAALQLLEIQKPRSIERRWWDFTGKVQKYEQRQEDNRAKVHNAKAKVYRGMVEYLPEKEKAYLAQTMKSRNLGVPAWIRVQKSAGHDEKGKDEDTTELRDSGMFRKKH